MVKEQLIESHEVIEIEVYSSASGYRIISSHRRIHLRGFASAASTVVTKINYVGPKS